MKFVPRRNQVIGRVVIRRSLVSTIVLVDESKVTKFILIDAVGSEAAANGVKVGDVIVPLTINNIMLNNGFRPVLDEKNIAFFVTDIAPGELMVQTDSGSKYVPLDADDAAQSLGAAPSTDQEEAA